MNAWDKTVFIYRFLKGSGINSQHPPVLASLRQRFNRIAASYDDAAQLSRQLAERLVTRLDFIRMQPKNIADIGSATGTLATLLDTKYQPEHLIHIDFAEKMLLQKNDTQLSRKENSFLSKVAADTQALPFRAGYFDLVCSNLLLNWCADAAEVFNEWRRILKPNGVLAFTTLGPDTLKEIRESWLEVDSAQHVYSFIDMHDLGDLLIHAGFLDPVMDVERYTLQYNSLEDFLRELKACGASFLPNIAAVGLMGKNKWQRFIDVFQKRFAKQKRYPIHIEVIFGHAFCPETWQTHDHLTGETSIPLEMLRRRVLRE